MEMGRQTEALVQFHRCLKLQTDFAPAKCQIKKVCFSDVYMFQKCCSVSHGCIGTLNVGLK